MTQYFIWSRYLLENGTEGVEWIGNGDTEKSKGRASAESFLFMQCCNGMHGQQVNVSLCVCDAIQHNVCLHPEPYQIQDFSCEA